MALKRGRNIATECHRDIERFVLSMGGSEAMHRAFANGVTIKMFSFLSILNAIEVAYTQKYPDHGDAEFREWIGDFACSDHLDGTQLVLKFGAELVADVVNGTAGSLLAMEESDRLQILVGHQIFQAIKALQDIALDWGVARVQV